MNYIVYKLTDNRNGLIYIGYTGDGLKYRWRKSALIKRFGHDDFNKEILFDNLAEKDVHLKEIQTIREYNSTDPNIGYNILENGGGVVHHSNETRKKISESIKGRHHSEEVKQRISESISGENHYMFGQFHSEEVKQRISESKSGENNYWYGKNHTEETKCKMSESLSGEKNPMYGKHQSIEAKRKICESQSKLTEDDVLEIRKRHNDGEKQVSIMKDYPIDKSSLSKIINRKTWKHV
jgi:hypothetical protein